MTPKRDSDNEPGNPSEKPAHDAPSPSGTTREIRMITAKDAGWITPTAFVLPLSFVPVDPPRPIKKAPPAG